jgi:hypothetical protein
MKESKSISVADPGSDAFLPVDSVADPGSTAFMV